MKNWLIPLSVSLSLLSGCSGEDVVPVKIRPIQALSSITDPFNFQNFRIEQEVHLEYLESGSPISSTLKRNYVECNVDQECTSNDLEETNTFNYENGKFRGGELQSSDFGNDLSYQFEDGKLVYVSAIQLNKEVEYRFTYDGNRLVKITFGFKDNPNLLSKKEYFYKGGNLERMIDNDYSIDEKKTTTFSYDDNPNPFYRQWIWQMILKMGFKQPGILPDAEAMIFSENNIVAASILHEKEGEDILQTRNYLRKYDAKGYPTSFHSTNYDNRRFRLDFTYQGL